MTGAQILKQKRGQPLWALGGLLLCWIGMRVAVFELPAPATDLPIDAAQTIERLVRSPDPGPPPSSTSEGHGPQVSGSLAAGAWVGEPLPPLAKEALLPLLPAPLTPRDPTAPESARHAAAHNLLWIAAMQAAPLPEVTAAHGARGGSPRPGQVSAGAARPKPSRWGADAWVLWRAGTSSLVSAGPVAPAYGGSQAGVVLRWDLAPGSRHRPTAYARAVHALGGQREGDLATGLAVRPLPALPVTAHGEARQARRGSTVELRPAAFLSGGVEGPLGPGLTARGYAQAGYVGGHDATAFADGSLTAERPFWRDRDSDLAAGAGAWGGAQRGAARLDVGPTASLRFRLGETTARLAADYRVRVAGNAEPAAGAALTLSAGF